MSTQYFVLAKSPTQSIANNEDNQVVSLPNKTVYLLPQVNLDYYCKHGLFENQLIDWCTQFCHSDKIFLDIGAHTGTYTLSLARLCKTVYAFEPQRMTYYALCGGIAMSNAQNVLAVHCGLGSSEQAGKKTLHIVSHDGGGSTIHHDPHQSVLRTEEIVIRTLDSYHLSDIGFMKLDVENNELDVLRGGWDTIQRCGFPPFIFELNDTTTPHSHELTKYIRERMGYKIIHIGGTKNMYLATYNA
jgi:FkbM family methyltransferase